MENENKDLVIEKLNKWCENKSNFVNLPEDRAETLQDTIKELIETYKLQKELIEQNKQHNDHLDYAYKELRKNFNKLTNEILGEDYYNMGVDTYNCDEETTEDLLYKYKKLKKEVVFYKVPYIICAILWGLLGLIWLYSKYSNFPNIVIGIIAGIIPAILLLLLDKLFKTIKDKG